MSLTMGKAPFGRSRAGEFNFDTSVLKPHTLYFEPTPKRIRALFGGRVVADSRQARLLYETGIFPVYYFPEGDVDKGLLTPTDHTTHCPFKGDASYYTVSAGGKTSENSAWYYPEPLPEAPDFKGYIALYHDRMDAWMEEDEEVIGHPRDPYHRLDVLKGSGRVTVEIDGHRVADSESPMVLFETNLPPRYYLPPGDVDTGLLSPSDTETICPYKGVASYWDVRIGDRTVEDAAWSYPDPNPEASRVEDYLCFQDGIEGVEVTLAGE